MKRVLVTGATGFLGSHIVRQLLKDSYEVASIMRKTSSRWRLRDLSDKVHWYFADINEPTTLQEVFESYQPEIVIHCAAYGVDYRQQDEHNIINTNLFGTYHLLQQSSKFGVKRFIHTGSCFEYGSKKVPICEEEILEPTGIYGVSKSSATLLVLQQGKKLNLPVVVLRPFGMYGPDEDDFRVVPLIINHLQNGKELQLTLGEQIRDYTYVKDVAEAFCLLTSIEKFPSGEIFNIGSGVPISIKELAITIAEELNHKTNLLKWGKIPYRPDEMKYLVADINKSKNILGWEHSTPLSLGITQTLKEVMI